MQPLLNSQISFGVQANQSRRTVIISGDKEKLTAKQIAHKKSKKDAQYFMGYFKWMWSTKGFIEAFNKFFG